jgi:hypothetical protein
MQQYGRGLHTAPSGAVWVAERIAWLPAFAVALALLWMIFRRIEQRPRSRRRGPTAHVAPPAHAAGTNGAHRHHGQATAARYRSRVGDPGGRFGAGAAARNGRRIRGEY